MTTKETKFAITITDVPVSARIGTVPTCHVGADPRVRPVSRALSPYDTSAASDDKTFP